MSDKLEWQQYYQQVIKRPPRPFIKRAVALNESPLKRAFDLGCGTGSEAFYLAEHGYQVIACDSEPDALDICRHRALEENVTIDFQPSAIEDLEWQSCDLVVASNSLYFLSQSALLSSWENIVSSLVPGGVFCGDFLGPKDDWQSFDMTTSQVDYKLLDQFLKSFDICLWRETDELGQTASGREKHWHVFTVIAKKKPS